MTENEDGNWIPGFEAEPCLQNKLVAVAYIFMTIVGLIVLSYGYFRHRLGWSTGKAAVVALFYPVGIPMFAYKYGANEYDWSTRRSKIVGGSVALLFIVFFVSVMVVGAVYGPPPNETSASTGPGSESGDGQEEIDVGVRISYGGSWEGALSVLYEDDSSTQSIGGSGTETIRIDGDPDTVSVNAQKQDDGGGTVTVEIIEDGDVVSESSTSAEYGVAQTSAEVDGLL